MTINPTIRAWLCKAFAIVLCAGALLGRASAADDSVPRFLFLTYANDTGWYLLKLPGDGNMMIVAWDEANKNAMCLATVGEGTAGSDCRRPKNSSSPEDLAKLINLIGKRDSGNRLVGTLTCDSPRYIAIYGKVDTTDKGHWCVYAKAVLGPDTPKLTPEENQQVEQYFEKLEKSGQYPVLDRSTSLAGPDTNRNGVRDDIEAWINKNWPEPKENKAVMQFAKTYQMEVTSDRSDANHIRNEGLEIQNRAVDCMSFTFPDNIRRQRVYDEIKAFTLNTKERIRAFWAYEVLLSGVSSTSPDKLDDRCDK